MSNRLDIINNAASIVRTAVSRGWCSEPKFTPHWTDAQIAQARRGDRSDYKTELFNDFLKFIKSECEFDVKDLQNWMEREGHPLSDATARVYLWRAVRQRRIKIVRRGCSRWTSTYATIAYN